MKNYFLDLKDRRLLEVKTMLEERGLNVFDFEENIEKISSFDVCVVSPSYRWKKETLSLLKDRTTVFGGAVAEEFFAEKERINYINLMENERFVVENARLTAEAFLADLISNTKKSLYEQNILVLGNGRVAKAVWQVLHDLKVKFDVSMRDEKECFLSELVSKKSFLLKDIFENLKDYDTVINTIPIELFSDDSFFKKGANVFELASKKCLNENNIKQVNYILCPSLPAKYMPFSAGKLIFNEIMIGEYK
ncbi:MAG: hypothetical protein EOM55_00125 [Clostridia bacterium]|nr:hypothetical protein [Clostridia bacterium]